MTTAPIDRSALFAAIESSWSAATAAGDAPWSVDNPSRGQCDVTSLVVLEYLGGDLQEAEVLVGGERSEHHYWNLLDDGPLDLTRSQFQGGETIEPKRVHDNSFVHANFAAVTGDLRERHQRLASSVRDALGIDPPMPIHYR